MNKIISWLKHFFELDKYDFERVIIDREVVDNIVELANQTLPKEFIAFLEGTTENKKFSEHSSKRNEARKKALRIYGLVYQEYFANPSYTVYKFNPPMTSSIVGSVHSHPGASNYPSRADLRSFGKKGMVHLIIRTPYSLETIQAYDAYGNMISFEVAS
jgi:proteasome lid subunit RPN8/RPN11